MVSGLDWNFCQWKMCKNIALVNERYCVDHLGAVETMKASSARLSTGLTVKQQQMLDWIRNYMRERGIPPTVREITDGLHISSTSVTADRLDRLVAKGAIRRDPKIARGLRITEEHHVRSAE